VSGEVLAKAAAHSLSRCLLPDQVVYYLLRHIKRLDGGYTGSAAPPFLGFFVFALEVEVAEPPFVCTDGTGAESPLLPSVFLAFFLVIPMSGTTVEVCCSCTKTIIGGVCFVRDVESEDSLFSGPHFGI
jgi:hypothetical protein